MLESDYGSNFKVPPFEPGGGGMERASVCGLLVVLLLPLWCSGQGARVFTIDTVVGGAVYDNRPAVQTPLNFPNGLWLDRDGSLWVADSGNQVIRRMELATTTMMINTAMMKVMVGGGTVLDDAVPVPGASGRLERPTHVIGDAAGNIYFSDSGNHRVRKLTPEGLVTTVMGTGEPGFSGDGGPARLARLNFPTGLAFDTAGNLYIAEALNCRIRRVDTAVTITTFAGNGRCEHLGDGGPALNAGLEGQLNLMGLAFDSRGNLYLTDSRTIRRIDAGTTVITTVAGTGQFGCGFAFPDGIPATQADLCFPHSMVFDQEDNLYFTSSWGVARVNGATGQIRSITVSGQVNPGTGLVRDNAGRLIVADSRTGLIKRVELSGGPLTTLAGTPEVFDGPADLAVLNQPLALAVDGAGKVYVADRGQFRIRRYDPSTGLVTTVVGGGSRPLTDLGIPNGVAATSVSLVIPQSIFVDSAGNIFFHQSGAVWKVDAGTGTMRRLASIADPVPGGFRGIVLNSAGDIFLSDNPNNRVVRIEAATGNVTTVAGNGSPGTSGDGGPATAAAVGNPYGLAFDLQGNLLLATVGPGAGNIRRVNLSTGVISSVQARRREGEPLVTPAVHAFALTVDGQGSIFFPFQGVIRQVRAPDSVLVTLAGGATPGYFGDGGLAALARVATGSGGIAADSFGNIYVADQDNGRIRRLRPTLRQAEIVVSPRILSFTALQGSSGIAAQLVSISSGNLVAFNWTLEVATSSGGNWLRPSVTSGTAPSTVSISVDSSPLAPGAYRGTVTVRATDASNSPQSVEVALTVQPAPGPVLGVSNQFLSFQGVQGGANPAAQTIGISNAGSGTLNWTATAETNVGGPWLRLSATSGTVPATLTVSADITGIAQGTYQGQITVRNAAGGEPRVISVVLTITRSQPILLPTQTGFLFVGMEGSLVVGPQSFGLLNGGQGRMDWQIQVNLPGGGDWLRVSPLQGTSEAGQPAPQVTLQLDPGRLRAGVHVALLTLTATGALNSPQTAIVLVNMLARGSLPVGTLNPLGLIFTSVAGATGVLTQGLTLASTGGQPLQFLVRARTQAGGNWLSVTPEQGALLSSSESLSLQVEARPAGLSPGVYFGSVTFGFGTGATQEVAVALVVASGAALAAGKSPSDRPGTWNLELGTSSAQCTPRRLVVVETRLGNRFALEVGWPAPILAQAVDDCGTPVGTATVTASFTTGEAPLVFQNLRDGRYSATWVPATRGQVGITIRAVQRGLEDGVVQVAGTLGQASLLPLVFREGWVNAASFDRFKPLAPGMIFSVFGNNLGEAPASAMEIPLPRQMGSLKVTIGGIDAPLFYSDSGQVNAQVPFELAPGAASLVASSRGSAGAPGTVTIVAAQPGIFTMSQTGTGQGVVVDAAGRIVDANNPVRPGEAVVIYATGLGMTEPRVGSGEAAPRAPLARVVAPVTASIGGREAGVDFAGLTPDLVGLYQVNARVPEGVAAGAAVPVVITQNGVASNTVTIAVQ